MSGPLIASFGKSIICHATGREKASISVHDGSRDKKETQIKFRCREAVAAAPGAPGHVLSYMHALEIMQKYAQVLSAARQLLLGTR